MQNNRDGDAAQRIGEFARGRRMLKAEFPDRPDVLHLYQVIALGHAPPETDEDGEDVEALPVMPPKGRAKAVRPPTPGVPAMLADAPTGTQERHARQLRAADAMGQAMQEKWQEADPFGWLEHDLDSATIIPDRPRDPRPLPGAPLPPPKPEEMTADSLLATILEPLYLKRRAAVRNGGPDRGELKRLRREYAGIVVPELPNGRYTSVDPITGQMICHYIEVENARCAKVRLRVRIEALERRVTAHAAAVAAIDSAIAQRRSEVEPIIAAALRSENGWRAVRGYCVNPKGQRLTCEKSHWERLSYDGDDRHAR